MNKPVKLVKASFQKGYWEGMFQPVAMFEIDCSSISISDKQISCINQFREKLFKYPLKDDLAVGEIFENQLLKSLAIVALDILSNAKMPIMSGARAIKLKEGSYLLGLPGLNKYIGGPVQAILFSKNLINSIFNEEKIDLDEAAKVINQIINSNVSSAPTGINTMRFLNAAHDLKIPWSHIVDNVYQFGWGVNSRLLDSSFTDQSALIGTVLAKKKYSCARMLEHAGLPVAKHVLVQSEQSAIKASEQLGFPLVVKPESMDGGKGVVVGIENKSDLISSYRETAKISSKILIEKYFPGEDFRLQVFRGSVFWAVHRRPATVVGDGYSTIETLIKKINQSREVENLKNHSQTDEYAETYSGQILIDQQLNMWLAKQGMNLFSVPALGCKIRLKGAANVSLGGTRSAVDLSHVHKDNIELAIKAVKLLRLDLAGVDLLIPDISKSYKEVGGVICEVNAQPQLSPQLPKKLIQEIIPKSGRVPILIVLGIDLDQGHQEIITLEAGRFGVKAKLVKKLVDCQSILFDVDVGLVVWNPSEVPDEYTAWPVDAVDGLIITNEIEDKNEIEATLRKFLKKIQKLELKKIVIDPQIDSIELILENYVVSSLTSAVTINSPDDLMK
jgi:D-alanine-D-alanine ligase-like ATP-grasp enzyme